MCVPEAAVPGASADISPLGPTLMKPALRQDLAVMTPSHRRYIAPATVSHSSRLGTAAMSAAIPAASKMVCST